MNLFRERAYRRLWAGQAVAQVGDYVFSTTLMLWIATTLLHDRPYAPAVSSAALVISAAVSVLVAPIAGVFVDRWDKVRVALTADLLRFGIGVVFVGLPFLVGVDPLWCVLGIAGVLATAQAVASVFFDPARFVIVADVVAADQRGQAASMTQASTAVAVILGPSLGAIVFVQVGPALSFAINAVTFLVSYAAIRSVPKVATATEVSPPRARSFGRELVEPLRAIASVPMLRMLLVTGVVVMLGAGALNSLDVYFVAENLRAGPQWYGLISGAFGGGLLAGAVVAGLVGGRIGYRRLFAGSLIVGGLVYLVYSRLSAPEPALVAIAAYGFAAGCVESSLTPLVLGAARRELLARVLSAFGPAFRLASIVSIAGAAWLVSLVRPGQTISVAGIGFNRIELVFTAAAALLVAGGSYAAMARSDDRVAVPR